MQTHSLANVSTCDISLLVRIGDAEQGGPLLFAAHLSLRPSQSRLCVELVIRSCCWVPVPTVFGCKIELNGQHCRNATLTALFLYSHLFPSCMLRTSPLWDKELSYLIISYLLLIQSFRIHTQHLLFEGQ